MKFRLRFAEQITGLFVLTALALIALVLVLMGINKRWYVDDPVFYSTFNTAKGMNRGMAIEFKGFQVGRVDDLELLDDNSVKVWFTIYKEYHSRVKEHTVIEFAPSPLAGVGGSNLLLHPGKYATAPRESGSYIPSLDFPEGKRIVREGLVETKSSAADIFAQVQQTLDTVNNETLPEINALINNINAAASGTNSSPLAQTMGNIEEITEEVAALLKNINARSDVLLDDIEYLADSLSKELADPSALVKKLFAEDSSVSYMLDDNMAIYRKIDSILAGLDNSINQVSDITEYINSTTPQITGLIEEARATLGEGKDVLEGLKNNPLLRGGITEEKKQPTTFQGYRDEDF